nr:Ycf15 [Primula ovalifolia]YP_010422416.1 Ycf15 [Primula ovalifolia]USG57402.1 Ycf15 [Primula ovalifolia]USG57419.1 Ycf15 [Primula ovalifolia]
METPFSSLFFHILDLISMEQHTTAETWKN